ncbi:MAG: carbohydrate binding domain-containing protein [Pirellulaceae bacterium]|nr:carbohydrate binding domain-containing protein [Pirellulaceae bacterium]
MPRWTSVAAACVWFICSACDGTELIVNGGYEDGLNGWGKFWARSGQGSADLASAPIHEGQYAVHIGYAGAEDWSFPQAQPLRVQPGETFELTGYLRAKGDGRTTLSVILYDADQRAMSWSFGGGTVRNTEAWRKVQSRFVIPPGAATIVPRVMGYGPTDTWVDDVSLVRTGRLEPLAGADAPAELTLENAALSLTWHARDATLTVRDKRSGRLYEQVSSSPLIPRAVERTEAGIEFQLLMPDGALIIDGQLRLDPNAAEFVFELRADGELRDALQFPFVFATQPGEFLIMPVNEGISYPVDDGSLPEMWYHLAGGHGLCMPFWGSTNLTQSLMAIVETADDAAVDIRRHDDRMCVAPEWLPQKGQFGPARRIRYVSLDQGGYVSMCKRYRTYAQQTGLFKTLAEKRTANPAVDLLIGAVNVWCWDRPGPEMCQDLREAGIERILWSNRGTPEQVRALNAMGVLSSRYDIYQDVMDPKNFPQLQWVHPDWTTDAWPADLIVRADGSFAPGWAVEGKEEGQWFDCGVLCDTRAVAYAQERIPAELTTHPYRCRFIDTTTASEWRECYHPDHPMTRSDSKRLRMALLDYVSRECGLVTGSETGHDAAVPYVHYFEGMLSLGPYRVPDAGRDMLRVWDEVPESLAKFQTGPYYRLPLWELVYHDCVVAQWYWGDYNNKLPAIWDQRDLYNALYGTPPMFMFNQRIWRADRERFVRSYQTATPVARATGYSEMLAHRWLSADHTLQQTTFANGVVVTVNFGERDARLDDGTVVPARSLTTTFPPELEPASQ